MRVVGLAALCAAALVAAPAGAAVTYNFTGSFDSQSHSGLPIAADLPFDVDSDWSFTMTVDVVGAPLGGNPFLSYAATEWSLTIGSATYTDTDPGVGFFAGAGNPDTMTRVEVFLPAADYAPSVPGLETFYFGVMSLPVFGSTLPSVNPAKFLGNNPDEVAAVLQVINGTNRAEFYTELTLTSAEITGSFGVPEPSTWAMMILGVGLTGAALRRRPTVSRA